MTNRSVVAAAVAVVTVAFSAPDRLPAQIIHVTSAELATITMDRRECPGPWLSIPQNQQFPMSTAIYTQLTVPGPISTVPEFHDCQRFMTDTNKYGGRFAIFASFRLDSLEMDLKRGNQLASVAAAEVYVPDRGYPRLGIRTRFNCLYLSSQSNWQYAYMVSVGEDESACRRPLSDPSAPGVTRLTVRRYPDNSFNDKDFPPVARWDRSESGEYFIGIKCGAAWCEVGGSTTFASTRLPSTVDPTIANNRVRRIKGWYDDQILALPQVPAAPSGVRAFVIPDSKLGDVTPGDFGNAERRWTPVAVIHFAASIEGYQSKLGLERGTNRLYMRSSPDGRTWEAMIVTESGRETIRRVERYGHEGSSFTIPATVRWRWDEKDETIWARCLEGCCQVLDS